MIDFQIMEKVVAIDGPSGSGKSTLARRLAEVLGLLYVDTGAMFRALGLACHRRRLAFEDNAQMQKFLREVNFCYGPRKGVLVEIDGEDYTTAIRQHDVSQWASFISMIPSVRTYLLEYQRTLPRNFICVMEGRDIGSVIFPGAFCKVFVTASVEVRAKRRYEQLQRQGQENLSLEKILKDVEERDQRDRNREMAPLIQTEDAVLIDTSRLGAQEALQQIVSLVREKAIQCQLKLPEIL